MERSHAAWLVGLPLLGAGWLSAHSLAYELVSPGRHEHEDALAASGHGYLESAPLLIAAFLAVGATAALARIVQRRPVGRRPPAWLFGTVPMLGFAAQEHLERLIHGSEAPWATAMEPVFLLGILLQLPFGLAAAVIARGIFAVADAFAEPRSPSLPHRPTPLLALPRAVDLLPAPALVGGHPGRAPPAFH